MSAWLAALVVLAFASPVAASPKGAQAKAAFNRGVAAYQKGNFEVASKELATSFKLEADVETLFAWAQTERQLDRCDKAIELYEKLLTFNLPAENKKVIVSKLEECRALLPAKPPKQPEKQPETQPEKQPETQPEKQPDPAISEPADRVSPPVDKPASDRGRSPWWKDPIGDGLVGLGAVGLGVGAFGLVTGWQAEKDSKKSEAVFPAKDKLAESRGKLGVISTIAGGVLVVGGIVRYATRGGGGSSKERTTVTGWLSTDGGGITALGRF